MARGCHRSHRLRVPANITLIRLPRYAPELNSAENIWEYLRKNKLSNTVFDNYGDILDKACQAWLFFAARSRPAFALAEGEGPASNLLCQTSRQARRLDRRFPR